MISLITSFTTNPRKLVCDLADLWKPQLRQYLMNYVNVYRIHDISLWSRMETNDSTCK